MSFFRNYQGTKEFPIICPITAKNYKYVTRQELSKLNDGSLFYVWSKNDALTKDYYSKLDSIRHIGKIYDEFKYKNNMSAFISFLQVNINTIIHIFDDYQEEILAITQVTLNADADDPLGALFLNYVVLEAVLPPNKVNNEVANASNKNILFTSDQKKLICQGAIQRIFHILVKHGITPTMFYNRLQMIHEQETAKNIKITDRTLEALEMMGEEKKLKDVKRRIHFEYTSDLLEKKLRRITLTYCQYYIKFLKKTASEFSFSLYFANQSGVSRQIYETETHALILANTAFFPAFFFKENPKYMYEAAKLHQN